MKRIFWLLNLTMAGLLGHTMAASSEKNNCADHLNGRTYTCEFTFEEGSTDGTMTFEELNDTTFTVLADGQDVMGQDIQSLGYCTCGARFRHGEPQLNASRFSFSCLTTFRAILPSTLPGPIPSPDVEPSEFDPLLPELVGEQGAGVILAGIVAGNGQRIRRGQVWFIDTIPDFEGDEGSFIPGTYECKSDVMH